MQRERQSQASNNRLIEKWPSRNLGGIWRIWRSDDEAVALSEYDTRPNCSESNTAHCNQDRVSWGSAWVSPYQRNSSAHLFRPRILPHWEFTTKYKSHPTPLFFFKKLPHWLSNVYLRIIWSHSAIQPDWSKHSIQLQARVELLFSIKLWAQFNERSKWN